MNVLHKIQQVLDAEQNEAQLDKFIADLRDSLATSSKQFLSFNLLALAAVISYHLVVYEGVSIASFEGLPLSSSSLVQKVFLVVPAALLAAAAGVGCLRRCQREVYDYLSISRYRVLGQTGLHELRLPSDYILGLFYLKTQGGAVGAMLSFIVIFLVAGVFTVLPVVYIVRTSALSLARYGIEDTFALIGALAAALLATASLLIAFLASRIRA
jgi:hypothetical protein